MGHKIFATVLVSVGFLLMAMSAWAHHSAEAAYDKNNPVTVTGVIAEVRLENPHSWFFVDVTDGNGTVTRWSFEGTTPTALIRSGYKRDSLKAGDKVTVKGAHARDRSVNVAAAREIMLEGGRSFIVGPGAGE
jgi:DNA/RNA endonuclease YhcR with UshA esterase domain